MSYIEPIHNLSTGGWLSPTTLVLGTSGYYAAMVFAAIPGKTIDKISFYCTASTSGVLDVRLETMNGSGAPSGTLAAANTSLTGISVAANTLYENTLTASYTVPTGATTYLAAKVLFNSGSSTIRSRMSANSLYNFPRVYENTSSGTQRQSVSCIAVRYTDGTYHPGTCCVSTLSTSSTFSNSTNPNEYGNKFIPTENLSIIGITAAYKTGGSSATAVLRIYDDAGNVLTTDSELAMIFNDTDGTNAGPFSKFFSSPVKLIAGRSYYVSTLATGGPNSSYTYNPSFGSAALRDSFMQGAVKVTRNGGAWTETATDCNLITVIAEYGYNQNPSVFSGGLGG